MESVWWLIGFEKHERDHLPCIGEVVKRALREARFTWLAGVQSMQPLDAYTSVLYTSCSIF